MIVIVDYEVGNFRNVQKAFERVGANSVISRDPDVIAGASVLVLPGVGAFGKAMGNLDSFGIAPLIHRHALEARKPLLGICLGMQLLAEEGFEGGRVAGLGVLPMAVRRLDVADTGLRFPHIGWNDIKPRPESRLFADIPEKPDFYFVHGYCVEPAEDSIVAATCDYGGEFVCAVERANVFATQFHPEKSQRFGRTVLCNFLDFCVGYGRA